MNSSNEQQLAKIAINKSLLKEYRDDENPRIVYMNNGDEFQIQLFNPYTDRIAASISIDGVDMGGQIVIRPGERIWLERHIDKARKLKFSTYEVEEGNAEVDNAIRRNGEVIVRFYHIRHKAKTPRYEYDHPWITSIGGTIPSFEFPQTTLDGYGYTTCLNTTPKQTVLSNSVSSLGINDTCLTACANTAKSVTNSILGDSDNSIKVNATLCCADTLSLENRNADVTCRGFSAPVTKETGRVESGSYSSQSFRNVDYDFASYAFNIETIMILPMSRKMYSSSDLQKVYCTNCGRKLNPKYKYCPHCGTRTV